MLLTCANSLTMPHNKNVTVIATVAVKSEIPVIRSEQLNSTSALGD